MQFSAKLTLAFTLLLAVAIGSTALAFWTAREADRQLARSQLSHKVYAGYLALRADAYHLFKELSDSLLIGDLDGSQTERQLLASLQQGLSTIRRLTAEEIALTSDRDEDAEELDRLASIERKLDSILRQYREVANLKSAGDGRLAERLAQLLDNSVDQSFAELIDTSLDKELLEVAVADAEAAQLLQRLRRTSITGAVLAVVLAALSVLALLRGLRRPLRQLSTAAEAVAAGNLEQRIDLPTRDEFGRLAVAFNRMTEEVATRERAIHASRDALEEAVKQRTDELQRANQALTKLDQSRRRFLADISHELRTPLTIIRGEAEIAQRSRNNDPASLLDVLKRVEHAATHTARLVDDLMFVARQESGETRLDLQSVDLAALVAAVCEEAEPLAIKTGVRIAVTADGEPARVRVDPTRIRQLLLVLIDNAARYGATNGVVQVRLARAAAGYTIIVSDDGIGMDRAEQERVFERFFRGAGAAERYIEGTGLGMPVAKSIAEAHGGSIAIESAPGRGTTVGVLLPARPRLEVVG